MSGKEPAAFRPTWPNGLNENTAYTVLCDDKGHNGDVWLRVFIARDGDCHVSCYERESVDDCASTLPSVRVRTGIGGGCNRRTRQALLWLADAIRRDNEENAALGRQVAQA